MLQQLSSWAMPAVTDRLVLALNHVLSSEEQATARLLPHAGRVLHVGVTGLPQLFQWPELLSFRITPAGLIEAEEGVPEARADLRLVLDLSQPARLMEAALAGQRPPVAIDGDAALAGDIAWLMDNLRWDFEDDLARVLGPAVAHQLAKVLRQAAAAAHQGLSLLARVVPGRGGDAAAGGQGRP